MTAADAQDWRCRRLAVAIRPKGMNQPICEQNTSTALLPPLLPIGDEVQTNGRTMRLVERRGDAALFVDADHQDHFEVVRIRIAEAHTWPNGTVSPRREVYPSATEWGKRGWTFTSGSHSNPETAARMRLQAID
jgi:hypothetical protein